MPLAPNRTEPHRAHLHPALQEPTEENPTLGLTKDVEAVLKKHGRDNKLIIEFVDDNTLFKAMTGSRQKFDIGARVKVGM